MKIRLHPHRRLPVLFVALVAAALALFGAVSASAATKTSLKGTLTIEPLPASSCASAVSICFSGTMEGKLKATLNGVGTSLIQTVDTPTTSIILFTSDIAIQAPDGNLFLKDATVLRTTTGGEFSGIWTVIGGTGAYLGATGVIQVAGSFMGSAYASAGTGTYVGSLFIQ